MFGDALVQTSELPQAVAAGPILVGGHEVRLIELAQGDIGPSAIVHVPALDAVIAGDVAYNRIHPLLAYCDEDQLWAWITSLVAIEALEPRVIVPAIRPPRPATRTWTPSLPEPGATSRTS